MFFAARGIPELGLVVATVIGGTLSAGSASALNCVYDRDIDEQMRRTRRRALPRHIVSPRAALVFGLALGVVSTIVLAVWVNWLSAVLAVLANAFYVLVYTMVLKRRTTQNIVWGGLAGCFPALIGWTAVTGSLSWVPVVLFMVVFFWTPPHTWALALRYREDYANVDVPMLPVVAPAQVVARQIVVYRWVMVATSLLLWPVADTGLFYPAAAAVLGAVFLVEAHRMSAAAAAPRTSPGSSRCGCSTPRTCTCRCCSSRSRSIPLPDPAQELHLADIRGKKPGPVAGCLARAAGPVGWLKKKTPQSRQLGATKPADGASTPCDERLGLFTGVQAELPSRQSRPPSPPPRTPPHARSDQASRTCTSTQRHARRDQRRAEQVEADQHDRQVGEVLDEPDRPLRQLDAQEQDDRLLAPPVGADGPQGEQQPDRQARRTGRPRRRAAG